MKIGFVSLGCPKNLVDSEVMMGLSQEGGHTLTPNPAEADVLVVNTCAFIDSAKEESMNTILELAEFKKNRLLQAARRHRVSRRAISRRAEGADSGNRRGARNRRGAGDRRRDRGRRADPDDSADARALQSPIANPQSAIPTSSLQRICTTPNLASSRRRGISPISRSPKAAITNARSASSRRCAAITAAARSTTIVREARSLAARGVREIILISQDTTFYGRDWAKARRCPLAPRAQRDRGHRLDPPALPLSDDDHRRHPRRHGRVREGRASTSTSPSSTRLTTCCGG